jgi:2'-5' RNA ligase
LRFAIMLTMDPATTGKIERIERDIAAVHHEHRPFDSDMRPHITLAACQHLDVSRCKLVMDEYANRGLMTTFHFGSLGVFTLESAVVFAAPVVTNDLLEGHRWFHQRLAEIASGPAVSYQPDNWVPHCTLAERIPKSLLPDVITIASAMSLPLRGQLEAVHLAEFPAARILHAVKLR